MKKIVASYLLFSCSIFMMHAMDEVPLAKFIDDSYKIIAVEKQLSPVYLQLQKMNCALRNVAEVFYTSHRIGKRKEKSFYSYSYTLKLKLSENSDDKKTYDLSSAKRWRKEIFQKDPFFIIVEKDNNPTDKKVLFIEKSLININSR
ncbi:MAG TPA: hypothetical protein VJJ26_01140 [Candidatus Babeliales bacterium]|nr:hypothetical protein [Candidatus Babeliales bacterium]